MLSLLGIFMTTHPYKIGIIGGGGVGLTYAAMLSEVADVIVKTRRPEQANVINADGIRFLPRDNAVTKETFRKARASAGWEDLATCDAVIIAVKSYDTAAVVRELTTAIGPQAIVLTLQNGLEAFPILKERVSHPERVFAGVTTIGARREDDRSVLIGDNRKTVIDSRAGKLAAVMQSMRFPAEVSDHIQQAVWDKMVLNTGQNALSAVTNRHVGQMLASPDCLAVAERLLGELKQVGEAEGFTFDYDLMDKLRGNWVNSSFYPSMWQDLHYGRRTEIDAINGAISRLGRQHHIPTPYNDMMTSLVHALE